ncbi:hypothetical protein DFH06DRAFT_1168847 [Mycena polygramma]|nr:hypothetical protein DFH06DRAFT_1168847 [Mycena polygramma]
MPTRAPSPASPPPVPAFPTLPAHPGYDPCGYPDGYVPPQPNGYAPHTPSSAFRQDAGDGGAGIKDVLYTDDAMIKSSDRIRRRCFNCTTTDTSTWRRSNLSPGKLLCNKCGIFERTHSHPRPVLEYQAGRSLAVGQEVRLDFLEKSIWN